MFFVIVCESVPVPGRRYSAYVSSSRGHVPLADVLDVDVEDSQGDNTLGPGRDIRIVNAADDDGDKDDPIDFDVSKAVKKASSKVQKLVRNAVCLCW